MVSVKAGDVPAWLRRGHAGIGVYLVYGPDTGLVSERARAIAEQSVDDPGDLFQLVRIDGETLADDPGRLADEAATVGLFGARRAVWIRPTGRNLVPAVEPLLEAVLPDTVVVIEAGDLNRSAPLRTLCEKSSFAAALPCYADEGRGLGDLVDEALREAGLTFGKDARTALLASLGGDRLASRAELDKLTLYAHGRSEITVDDVDAVLSDVSSLALDAVVDAAFSGDSPALEAGTRRLAAEGLHAAAILGAALRHALQLLSARLEIETGRHPDSVIESWRGLHFRRKPAVRQALQRWTAAGLRGAIDRLQAAILDTRRLAALDDAIAARILLELSRAARR